MEHHRADDLIDGAWDAPSQTQRAELAREALSLDPEAIDGYVVLALATPVLAEKVALLSHAVTLGERRWSRHRIKTRMCPLEERPFERALQHLVLALCQLDNSQEATRVAERMLRLFPNDNTGIRFVLMHLYGEQGQWEALERHLQECRGDEHRAHYAYAAVLCAYMRAPEGTADATLAVALNINIYVPLLLEDLPALPTMESGVPYSRGSPQEAIDYAKNGVRAWQRASGSLEWLARARRSVHPATGDAELPYP
jgi:tetratricopeptide (TPR) repeat protein